MKCTDDGRSTLMTDVPPESFELVSSDCNASTAEATLAATPEIAG